MAFLLAGSGAPCLNAAPQEPRAPEKKFYMTTGLMLRKAVIVAASPEQIWEAFTTIEGVKTFFAPDAWIDLAINGEYEMYFLPDGPKGARGGEGCRILSFIPNEMISFSWNAPPSLPAVRNERTWVILQFIPKSSNETQVSLVHLGWGAGDEWQKALAYFDKAWELVLARLAWRFQHGPLDWKNPFTPGK